MRTLELIYYMVLLNWTEARYVHILPKLFDQESSIIVDTVNNLIKQQKEGITRNNTIDISAPKAPQLKSANKDDEELLKYIARHKLGLKRLDKLPNVNALGELLGTASAKETMNFINDLIATEQGLAAIKGYIESVDDHFVNSVSERDNKEREDNVRAEQENDDGNDVHYENVKELKSNAMFASLLMHRPPQLQLSPRRHKMPLLVLQPLPHHYPVPIRPVLVKTSAHSTSVTKALTNSTAPLNSVVPQAKKPSTNDLSSQVVLTTSHLNTPIMKATTIAPHVHHLAKLTNISPLKLDRFLQSKPKLAVHFNSFTGSIPTDRQVVAAIQNAIEHDDELKKLLASAETFK